MSTEATGIDQQARQSQTDAAQAVVEQKIIIRGGKPLRGTVRVGGAKNAVLKMMAGALLAKDVSILRNVPNLTDVYMMAEVIRYLGAKVEIT
ncbi:MAG: hypothetical protein K2X29_04005, partial [Candidatus Obscuribacterales bacterium]|nr:hypothetical protein [Candidatus Obscuribacterales bacterium]